MLDWLEMQGHWGYIWTALAVTAVLLAADLLPPWLRQRKLREQIRARLRRESQ
jgi:heme exporter protein CcmD